jgi:hypothetical protein
VCGGAVYGEAPRPVKSVKFVPNDKKVKKVKNRLNVLPGHIESVQTILWFSHMQCVHDFKSRKFI